MSAVLPSSRSNLATTRPATMTIHTEKGVIVGNIEDKSNPTNPVSARLIQSFDSTLLGLLERIGTGTIHEVGCGEGRLTQILSDLAPDRVRASIMKSIASSSDRQSTFESLSTFCEKSFSSSMSYAVVSWSIKLVPDSNSKNRLVLRQ